MIKTKQPDTETERLRGWDIRHWRDNMPPQVRAILSPYLSRGYYPIECKTAKVDQHWFITLEVWEQAGQRVTIAKKSFHITYKRLKKTAQLKSIKVEQISVLGPDQFHRLFWKANPKRQESPLGNPYTGRTELWDYQDFRNA